ncbi:MAG: M48 family metalloprotease [Alphaproteobacteria bacterium]|nr:M48 family metalloprotease [Alphaproteobacteria bacterium]
MRFCNPSRRVFNTTNISLLNRLLSLSLALVMAFTATVQPAAAQGGIALLRDTEIERLLKSYEEPLLKVAGIDPNAVHIYLVNDASLNAFVAEGQNIFIHTGLFLQTKTPNELIGVLAHETGHMAGGHLSTKSSAMRTAAIPVLVSMALGIVAMAMGGGNAGMAILMGGQQFAQAQYLQFSRSQEATADQMGMTYLERTHQSGRGMAAVFQRLADEEAMSAFYGHDFISDHPASRERISSLEDRIEASPYKDVKDSPEAMHEYRMVQAKLAGYLSGVQDVLNRYPASDTSEEARYARAMAYFRKPDIAMALKEVNSLIAQEPNNPYFQEMLGQIYVDLSQPEKGIAPYQKAVDALPDAPLLRVALASAQVAFERGNLAQAALSNLKVAVLQEDDNPFAWYLMSQAYARLGNIPMADLSTAEQHYSIGNMGGAMQFAMRAQRGLTKGSAEWQRANDILSIATAQARDRR